MPTGSTPGRARELAQLGDLGGLLGGGEHGQEESALRLGPGRGVVLALLTRRL